MAIDVSQVQDIVVGSKSLNDVAKPSEIASLFMDDEELAESVAKRKQAEAHGYVAPTVKSRPKSAFGDGLGRLDDDEDDFFSGGPKATNNEDDDFGDVDAAAGANAGDGGAKKSKSKSKTANGSSATAPAGSGAGTPKKKSSGGTKRKAADGEAKETKKVKKVKIAVEGETGEDGGDT